MNSTLTIITSAETKRILYAAALLLALLVPGIAEAACVTAAPINRDPSLGNPFATRDVTRMDTHASDNVWITGGQ